MRKGKVWGSMVEPFPIRDLGGCLILILILILNALNFLETLRCPRCDGIGDQEGHPVIRPRHLYVSGPLKVLNANYPWPLIWTRGVDLRARASEWQMSMTWGWDHRNCAHGPPWASWDVGGLLEHNKTTTVLDLDYSQHADPILDVEVKTVRGRARSASATELLKNSGPITWWTAVSAPVTY